MEKSILKYLAGFNGQFAEMGDGIRLHELFQAASAGYLDVLQDYSLLRDVAKTINVLEVLLGRAHVQVRHTKELRHLQMANKMDSQGFNMTVKEPKLWKNNGGKIAPEHVYNNMYEDEIAIYENRFIKLVIDEIAAYLYELMSDLAYSFGNIHSRINSGPTIAGALNMAEGADSDVAGILAHGDDPDLTDYEAVQKLYKKVTRFKHSQLYIECAKKPPLSADIQLTNILTHDAYYRACLIFHNKLKRVRFVDISAEDTLYNNVLIKLLYALNKCGYTPMRDITLEQTAGRYLCDSYIFTNGTFYIRLNSLNRSELEIATYLNRQDEDGEILGEYVSHTAVDVVDYVPELTEKTTPAYRASRISYGFSDAFNAVLSRYPIKADGILNFVNRGSIECSFAEDFVRSLTCVLDGSHKLYSERCPICGSRYVVKGQHSMECSQCGGLWSPIVLDDKEKIWIKRMRYSTN